MNYPSISEFIVFKTSLENLPESKMLISTINAHSYNVACEDYGFRQSLKSSHVLLPDGISIVLAFRWLTGEKFVKIAGTDLFFFEMERINQQRGTCFFLGSSNEVLTKIKARAAIDYPCVAISTYSPPYKPEFSFEDNRAIIAAVNEVKPDVLFIGMTAPKQEKWAHRFYDQLGASHICSIGAVFDFYSGSVKRAPEWIINAGMEWLYRLLKEPKRLGKRYIVGNTKFILKIFKQKFA